MNYIVAISQLMIYNSFYGNLLSYGGALDELYIINWEIANLEGESQKALNINFNRIVYIENILYENVTNSNTNFIFLLFNRYNITVKDVTIK